MSLKKKDFRPHNNPMVAPKRLDKKQKKKLGKTLWESAHDIDPNFSDGDSGMSEEETKKVVDGGAGTGGGEEKNTTFVLKPKKGTSAWIYFNIETAAKLKE